MKIVLHIGNHKTGSTSIQTALSENFDILAENGILYPKTGRVAGAHHLWPLSMNNVSRAGFSSVFDCSHYIELLKKEISLYNDLDVIILSSEEFFLLDNFKFELFLNDIRREISNISSVDCVCVLRNQVDHIESSYKFSVLWEEVKEQRTFEEFVTYNISNEYHFYGKKFSYMEAGGFFDHITLIDFDLMKADGKLVFNFLKEIDIFLDIGEVENNSSLSRLATIILNLHNCGVLGGVNCSRDRFVSYISEGFKDKDSIYSCLVKDEVFKYFESDNVSLMENFGIDMNSKFSLSDRRCLGEKITRSELGLILNNFNVNIF